MLMLMERFSILCSSAFRKKSTKPATGSGLTINRHPLKELLPNMTVWLVSPISAFVTLPEAGDADYNRAWSSRSSGLKRNFLGQRQQLGASSCFLFGANRSRNDFPIDNSCRHPSRNEPLSLSNCLFAVKNRLVQT